MTHVWRKFYNAWKLCDSSLKNGLWIVWPKCPVMWPDDVVLWTRLWICNTIWCVLAVHSINIPSISINIVVVYRSRDSTQFRLAQHVILPQKLSLVINSVNNTTSQDESGLLWYQPRKTSWEGECVNNRILNAMQRRRTPMPCSVSSNIKTSLSNQDNLIEYSNQCGCHY